MWYHPELSYKENLLLEAENEPLLSEDAAVLLGHISISYASNLLTELWGQRLLTRKKVKMKKGGIKYAYSLSWSGRQHIKYLKEKGY